MKSLQRIDKNGLLAVCRMKEVLLNLRIKEDVRDDLKTVAEMRGATMSGLLHQYIFKIIREEKERAPEMFLQKEQAKIESVAKETPSKVKILDITPTEARKRKTG